MSWVADGPIGLWFWFRFAPEWNTFAQGKKDIRKHIDTEKDAGSHRRVLAIAFGAIATGMVSSGVFALIQLFWDNGRR